MTFMHTYPNFTLSEFVNSETAKKRKIDNTPSFEIVSHLEELVSTILQPIRTAYGKPLNVTSGYRCPALNKAVGGSPTSAHLYGYAADIQPADGNVKGLIAFAERFMKDNGIMFDQSISEKSGKTEWWHIAVRNGKGEQRGMTMTLTV